MKWKQFVEECDVTYAPLHRLLGNRDSKMYLSAKLQEEKGEVSGAVAKFLSGNYDHDELERRLKEEAGDTLWVLAMLDKYHDISPIALRHKRVENYTTCSMIADIVYYGISAVFKYFDHSEIMENAIAKIRKRQAEGTVYGKGVNR